MKTLALCAVLASSLFAGQAMAASVIGKVGFGSDGKVLIIPTTYLYVGSVNGSDRIPEAGCVKVVGPIKYGTQTVYGRDAKFARIDSVQILDDAQCADIE